MTYKNFVCYAFFQDKRQKFKYLNLIFFSLIIKKSTIESFDAVIFIQMLIIIIHIRRNRDREIKNISFNIHIFESSIIRLQNNFFINRHFY